MIRNPALRRIELAFLLFNAVEFGTWVAILLYAYDVSGPAAVGVVALAQLLPAGILAPFAASLADRYPRERVLLVGYLVQALVFGAAGAGMLFGAPVIAVYIAGAAAAAALTVIRPTQGSLLPSLARTPEELTAANGLSGTVEGAGLLLGPLAAAVILGFSEPGAVFVAGSVACVAASLLVRGLPRSTKPAVRFDVGASAAAPGAVDAPAPQAHVGFAAGLRLLGRAGDTRLVVGLLGLRMLTSGAVDVLFVLLALEVFRTGESGAGILNAALGLGTVVGGAATFTLVGRPRLAPALALSALAWGGAMILVGTAAPAWMAPALIALGGIGYSACDVTGRTILQRVTPDDVLARVLGGLEGIGLVGLALGALIVPILVTVFGIQATLVVVGLVLPAGVGMAWIGLRRIDDTAHVPIRELRSLRHSPVFAALPPPQLETVARRTRWITVATGERVIREGDLGDRYYVIESGRMRVTRLDQELRVLQGTGVGFGEIALLRDIPRTATVTAIEPCVVLALDRADFLAAVTGHEDARGIVEGVAAERARNVPPLTVP